MLDYLKDIDKNFTQSTYNIISNNCNHFTNDICFFLTGKPIPDYVLNQHKELISTPIGKMIMPMLEQMNVPQMIEGKNNNSKKK